MLLCVGEGKSTARDVRISRLSPCAIEPFVVTTGKHDVIPSVHMILAAHRHDLHSSHTHEPC